MRGNMAAATQAPPETCGPRADRPGRRLPSLAVSVPVLDLFAGAGGLSSGLVQAGFAPVGAVEVMEAAACTYEALHDLEVDRRRLEDIPARELLALRGRVPVVAGGPPCQPWSTGGLRRGHADERDGFRAMFRALELIRPQAFVVENVAGLERGRTRPYFLDLVAVLRDELGYRVAARTLNAADFGVPQQRLRMFIVGLRREGFAFPEPTHGPGRRHPWRTAGDVLTADPVGEPNRSIVTYAKRPDLRPSPYDGLLFNGGGRPINLLAPARTILASAGGNKTPFVDTLGIVPGYHRQLLAGGATRSGIVPGARRITVQESAALQSFPPETRFHGRRSTQYTLVGNAVPPRLARAVGEALHAIMA
jgi:DNA (cytosine-5)-methyltransferase 1